MHLLQPDLTIATRLCSAAKRLSFVAYSRCRTPQLGRITTAMRDMLHWLPVRQRITFQICMLVRNCVNGSALIYLQEICNSVSADVHWPRLHSTDHGDLVVTRANTDRFGWRGFSVLWNKLPPDIRKVSNRPEQFARALKTFLFPNSTTWTLSVLQASRPHLEEVNLLPGVAASGNSLGNSALTSTSEDNIKRRVIAKTSTSTSD